MDFKFDGSLCTSFIKKLKEDSRLLLAITSLPYILYLRNFLIYQWMIQKNFITVHNYALETKTYCWKFSQRALSDKTEHLLSSWLLIFSS